MAEDHATERPGKEAEGIGRKGEQRARQRIERREKQSVEHQCRSDAIDEEVEPFDHRADQAGAHDRP